MREATEQGAPREAAVRALEELLDFTHQTVDEEHVQYAYVMSYWSGLSTG